MQEQTERLTVFGRVVTELMEACGVTLDSLYEEANERGLSLDVYGIERRMETTDYSAGSLRGFVELLELEPEEVKRLALAYAFDEAS